MADEMTTLGAGALAAAILNSEGFKQVYGDLAAPLAKQMGELFGDLGKCARWLLPGIQFMAHSQDMLLKERLRQVNEEVPEDRQVPPSPSIFLPVLESLSRQEEGNILADLYMNLLKRAIDRDRQNEAHPGFIRVIGEMSGDEAVLLWHVRQQVTYSRLSEPYDSVFRIEIDKRHLLHPQLGTMAVEHLANLGVLMVLACYENETTLAIDSGQVPPHNRNQYSHFSKFGRLFCDACLPDNLPSAELATAN